MKRNIILFTALVSVAYVVLSSSASGPGSVGDGNRTGGPGSNGKTCSDAGCHGANTASTQVTVNLIDSATNGLVMNGQYIPSHTYLVSIEGINSTHNQFGFQCEVLNSSDASTGKLTAGTSQHVISLGGKSLIEHSARLAATSGILAANFKWTAPAAGTGNITFYAMLNAVNGDASTTGDAPSLPYSLQLTETGATAVATVSEKYAVSAYPNPVTDVLQIKIDANNISNNATAYYAVNVYDASGRYITKENVQANGNATTLSFNTSGWIPGLYYVRIATSEGKQRIIPVVKK